MNIIAKISSLVIVLLLFTASSVKGQSIITATGGADISADSVGGNSIPITGPVITEISPGQLTLGFIKLLSPSGFEWDTTAVNAPSISVTLAPGLNGQTKLLAALIRVNPDTLVVQVQQTSDNGGNRAGRITFSNIYIRPVSGIFPNAGNILNVGNSAPSGTTSYGSLNIVPGAPTAISVETEPDGTGTVLTAQNLEAGNSLTAYSISRDQFGNFLENIAADSWSVINPTGAVETSDLTPSNGNRTITLASDSVGTGNIQAVQGTLNPVITGTITVIPSAATDLILVTQPSDTVTAGISFPVQPVVKIVDAFGNITTTDNTTQITVARSSGTGTLQGSVKTVTVSAGIATFSGLSFNVAGEIDLRFSASGFNSIISDKITVLPGPASTLSFKVQPPNGARRSLLVPFPEVQITDDFGNNVSQSGTLINLSIVSGPVGSSFFNSTTSVATNASGVAIFDDIALSTRGDYTIQAADNAGNLSSVTSAEFVIVEAGELANFVIEASGGGPIDTITAGQTFTIDIDAVDGAGSILDGTGQPNFTGKAYITVSGNTGTGINDSTIAFSAGELSHTLTLETAGTFTITATRGQVSTSSNSFVVTPGNASSVGTLVSASPKNIVANGVSTSLISIILKDSFGNELKQGGDNVIITSTAGTVLGTIADNQNGSYEQLLRSSTTVDTAFVSATINGQALISQDTVVFVPGGLNAFLVQSGSGGTIGTQTAGTSFPVDIQAVDKFNNRVTAFNGSVNITANKTFGVSGGSGVVSLTNGLLNDHSINLIQSASGDAVISVINTSGTQSGSSNPFTILPEVSDPANSVITAQNRFIQNDGISTTTITVQLRDQFGNDLITGGETIGLTTDFGSFVNAVQDSSNGRYSRILQSTTQVVDATITGTVNSSPITDNAKVFFAEFNEWTSSGGGGSNPIDWSRSSNWTLGTPTAFQAVVIPSTPSSAVKFPILDVNASVTFLQIENGASVAIDPGFTLTVTEDLGGTGTLIVDDSKVLVGGDVSLSNLNAGNSTVVLNGDAPQTISGSIVSDSLRITNTAGTTNITGYINASTAAEVGPGSTLNLSSGSVMELFGDLTGTGSLSSTNADIFIGGDITLVNSNFSGSDVFLNGTSLQTLSPSLSFNNLTVSNISAGGIVLNGNATVNGVLAMNSTAKLQANQTLSINSISAGGASLYSAGDLGVTTVTSAPLLVEFNGTGNQRLINFGSFNNLTVNKTTGDLFSLSDVSVAGTLTLTQGDLVVGSGKSLLAPNRSITAGHQLRFQREITSSGWHLLSSPISDATYDNWLDSVVTQGYAGSTLGNAPLDSLQPNVLYYLESFDNGGAGATDLQRWRAPSDASATVLSGTGYFVYIFGDIPADSRYNNVLPDTLDVGGSESVSAFNFPVTYTATADTGWNLIGNPYGATLDWDNASSWTKTNIDQTIYIWDRTANSGNGEYLVWNGVTGSLGDGLIAPFQGFWVKANAASPVLTVNPSVKTTGGVFYKDTPSDNDALLKESAYVNLSLSSEELTKNTYLMFSEGASKGKDTFDGYQLEPFTDTFLEFYTKYKDGSALTINNLPRLFGQPIEIPLYIDGFRDGDGISSTFSIQLDSLKNVPDSWEITLIDLSANTSVDLRENSRYDFSFTSNNKIKAKSQGLNVQTKLLNNKARFHLRIVPGEDASDLPSVFSLSNNYPNPFNPSTKIDFTLPVQSVAELTIYDIMGRKVATILNEQLNAGYYTYEWDASGFASGVYLYRLRTTDKVFVKKMTLIK